MTAQHAPKHVAMDMIHSEEELRHAFFHLLAGDGGNEYLAGHECLVLYRNVRKKYVDYPVKDGPRQFCSYRTIDQGVLAACQAGVCFQEERPASALYACINPRHVPNALKETHNTYFQWLEHNSGTSKEQVKKGARTSFAGTLYKVFEAKMYSCKSRTRLSMIDVDDNDPTTWLARVREAMGECAIEMIVDTKNGFHVIYHRSKMSPGAHKALNAVLESDNGDGQESKVSNMKGGAISCALPGAYQSDHTTRVLSCSCRHRVVGDDS